LGGSSSPAAGWRSSATPPDACANCGGTTFDADGVCANCGTRRPSAPRHSDIDLEVIAGVSDIGKRHHNNEDALGLAVGAHYTAAVVCDGVSASSNADVASNAAATAAIRSLASTLDSLTEGDVASVDAHKALVEDAIETAVDAAQAAATQSAGADIGPNPPSTTLVCAVVTKTAVTIGWVGDSRAYWLADNDPDAAMVLTVDDTLAGQLAAAGILISDDTPAAGALLRWLGADATDTRPHLNTIAPETAGRVVVCSDGLYRYVPAPVELARVTPSGRAVDVAAALVSFAIAAGGHDNVTVVVMPFGPT
jgi:serine/threonine protein phosphatase PrpC